MNQKKPSAKAVKLLHNLYVEQIHMGLANNRLVVRVTSLDKSKIKAHADRIKVSMSDVLRRGALSYTLKIEDAGLDELADRAAESAINSIAAIEDTLNFVAASNVRIAAMELRQVRPGTWKAF